MTNDKSDRSDEAEGGELPFTPTLMTFFFIALLVHFFKDVVYFADFIRGEVLETFFEWVFAAAKPLAKACYICIFWVGCIAPTELVA